MTGERPVSDAGGPIPEVDVAAAAAQIGADDGALLVDVREAYELAEAHVPGALHVPLSDFANAASAIPAGRPLLLMCASGRRSLVAAEYLRRHGHADVANVSGGIVEWRRRGLPTASGPPAEPPSGGRR